MMVNKTKIRWNGNNPVVFYDKGGERIELKTGETAEVFIVPTGTMVEVLTESSLSEIEKSARYEKFKWNLDDSGLSPIRKGKVLAKFKSEQEMVDSLDSLPFDEVTNKFLQGFFKKGGN